MKCYRNLLELACDFMMAIPFLKPSEEPAIRLPLSCSSAVDRVVLLAIQLMFDGTQIAIIDTLKWPIS